MKHTPYPENRVVATALKKVLRSARSRKLKRRINTVVMYSGGLDSVAMLASVLQETDHKVHVHHIQIVNFEKRDNAEYEAVKKTLDYMRENYRDFDYSTSKSEFLMGKGGGTDLQLQMFIAGRLHSVLGGLVDNVLTGNQFTSFRMLSEGAILFNAMFQRTSRRPEWLRPLYGIEKIDVYAAIPPELAKLSWSCRKPVIEEKAEGIVSTPCGKCHACQAWATLPIKHKVLRS
tara:strand:- start:10 stop:705 length:696 start_codon:yes stop_codon:yes gene_type:complete